MQELKLSQALKKVINEFTENLKQLYHDELVSVVLYGSAASGELIEARSDVNILVVLKDTGLQSLEKSRKLVRKFLTRKIEPLFLNKEYFLTSSDVFPIEFLDMKENYSCLYGEDIFSEIKIDLKNLRFQCEQELKSKLVLIKQRYLRINLADKAALSGLLFKSFTSVMHILRNLIRLKGKNPSYNKENVLNEIAIEFKIDTSVFLKILEAKRNSAVLKVDGLKELFADFVPELDKITEIVDKL